MFAYLGLRPYWYLYFSCTSPSGLDAFNSLFVTSLQISPVSLGFLANLVLLIPKDTTNPNAATTV